MQNEEEYRRSSLLIIPPTLPLSTFFEYGDNIHLTLITTQDPAKIKQERFCSKSPRRKRKKSPKKHRRKVRRHCSPSPSPVPRGSKDSRSRTPPQKSRSPTPTRRSRSPLLRKRTVILKSVAREGLPRVPERKVPELKPRAEPLNEMRPPPVPQKGTWSGPILAYTGAQPKFGIPAFGLRRTGNMVIPKAVTPKAAVQGPECGPKQLPAAPVTPPSLLSRPKSPAKAQPKTPPEAVRLTSAALAHKAAVEGTNSSSSFFRPSDAVSLAATFATAQSSFSKRAQKNFNRRENKRKRKAGDTTAPGDAGEADDEEHGQPRDHSPMRTLLCLRSCRPLLPAQTVWPQAKL